MKLVVKGQNVEFYIEQVGSGISITNSDMIEDQSEGHIFYGPEALKLARAILETLDDEDELLKVP